MFHSKQRLISLIVLLLIGLGIPVAVFLSQQQQNIFPKAASGADLVVDSFQLTDAGGNVKTTFYANEDIYIRIVIRNAGGTTAISQDGSTYSVFYSNKSSPAAFTSDDPVSAELKNGQFGPNAVSTNSSIYGSSTQSRFLKAKSWRISTPGTYTAQVLINHNKFATESNYDNNRVFLQYNVIEIPTSSQGKTYTSPPSGFDGSVCPDPGAIVPNLRGCVMEKAVNGKTFGKITNVGSTTRKVGMASYKAYNMYPDPYPSDCPPTDASCTSKYNWIWTQTLYSFVTSDLAPGKTLYFEVAVPECAWQTDVFEGSVYPSFTPTTRFYSGENRFIDGYYNTKLSVCEPVIPSPTPTNTPSPSTPTKTPTPTETPVPTNTLTPTPPPDLTLTPTPSACPLPPKVNNVRVICPYCKEVQL